VLAILQDSTDPTRDVILETIVPPAQKAGIRADPEGAVRRTQQRHDRPVEDGLVRPGVQR
jgi:hypothetical protein